MRYIEQLSAEITKSFFEEPGQDQRIIGLNIYRWNYLASHLDILASNYAAVYRVLGQQNFKYFARNYLQQTPPNQPNIETYGAGFSKFLGEQSQLDELFYLEPLGELDWYWSFRFSPQPPLISWRNMSLLWNSLLVGENEDLELDPDDKVKVSLIVDEQGDFCFKEQPIG